MTDENDFDWETERTTEPLPPVAGGRIYKESILVDSLRVDC